jgi:hypothetical protein
MFVSHGNDDAPTEAAGKAFIASIGLWLVSGCKLRTTQILLKGKTEASIAGIGDVWNGSQFVSEVVE